MKRQSTEWETMFARFAKTATDEQLSSKLYKKLMELNFKNKQSDQKIPGRPK